MIAETVPFLDLMTPHRQLEEELLEVVRRAIRSASFIGGFAVTEFEESFARCCGTRYCIGVGSGTDALRFAIIAAGIGSCDTVVTVPNTFIATTEAISQAGASPEFVDIDESTYNMDPEKLRIFLEEQCVEQGSGNLISRRSGKRIAGIIPVHLYGQMADMDPILELAEKYRLVVIEDACQAHGAKYFSRKHNKWFNAGSMGRSAAFSFYPGKNLGACGEAGAVVTNDEEVMAATRILRDHGQSQKYYHDVEGYNGRLDAIQAGMLAVKLEYLEQWNASRRRAAQHYNELFASYGTEVVLPSEKTWSKAVHHLYVIRTCDRDGVRAALKGEGIDTGIHYPVPLHQQRPYLHLGYRNEELPIATLVATQILSLPMFPSLRPAQQELVVSTISKVASPVPG